MLSPLRNRFGIPGVISVIALVFAMFGGAYAASNSSDGAKATASAKKGPPGPRGPRGKTGATGPAGPAGAKGDAGAAGANGTNGGNGKDGTSVTGTAFAGSKGGCTEGGIEFASASGTNFACNGKKGTNGTPGTNGEPWTPNNTLPVGATETGTWMVPEAKEEAFLGGPKTTISFPIKLTTALDESHVHAIDTNGEEVDAFGEPGGPSTQCLGTAAAPTANSGHLCVYALNVEKTLFSSQALFVKTLSLSGSGAAPVGAFVELDAVEKGGTGYGTWAVTG